RRGSGGQLQLVFLTDARRSARDIAGSRGGRRWGAGATSSPERVRTKNIESTTMSLSSYRLLFALILAAGCLSRAALVWVYPMDSLEQMKQKSGDEQYYFGIAQNLVEKGEFVGNYKKAYRPPGYPAFLAGHLAAFGENHRVVQVTQNVVFLLAVAL